MNPRLKMRMSPDPSPGLSRPVQGGLYVAALILIPLLAIGGSDSFRAALDFTTGVLSLVSLTASVAWGLIATDRLLLSPRHRLLAQGIHRTTAIASLGFLLLHGTVKVSLGHVELIGALIPFGLGVTGTSALIGFGSLAGFLMVVAATTGVLRSALAGNVRVAGRWRPLHMLAYPAWCSALVHGLYTGRPAATWVVTMYCLALAGVAVAVSVRLLPRSVQRRIAARIEALTGAAGDGPAAADEQARRDMLTAPLPGVSGVGGAGGMSGRNRSTVSAGMDRMDRVSGVPSQRTFERDLQAPLGQSRPQPPRIAAPSPQLYEAPRPSGPEPEHTSAPGGGRGPGMSAAYRAVSLGAESAPPLAERVPMTEEIPVVSETGPLPGSWPTPSPPPPAQAVRPTPATPPTYDTPPPPLFDTAPAYGSPPSYDTGSASFGAGFDTGSAGFDAGSSGYSATAGGYDAVSGGLGAQSTYDATAMYTPPAPSYDAGVSYDPLATNEAAPPYTTSPYDTGGIPTYDTGSMPTYDTGSIPPYEETAAMPGLFQPPAGEPWNAPAGERP
ncbi:hypothetical protein ABZ208_24950 [Streptomyces sp. NPDC006208]|uniref:hypothetical protein n=1 Tax=Streptomyces sp. NPDC006208 TaxID=3156734 RepID=UPI00339EA049